MGRFCLMNIKNPWLTHSTLKTPCQIPSRKNECLKAEQSYPESGVALPEAVSKRQFLYYYPNSFRIVKVDRPLLRLLFPWCYFGGPSLGFIFGAMVLYWSILPNFLRYDTLEGFNWEPSKAILFWLAMHSRGPMGTGVSNYVFSTKPTLSISSPLGVPTAFLPRELLAVPAGEVARGWLARSLVDDVHHARSGLFDGVGSLAQAEVVGAMIAHIRLHEPESNVQR